MLPDAGGKAPLAGRALPVGKATRVGTKQLPTQYSLPTESPLPTRVAPPGRYLIYPASRMAEDKKSGVSRRDLLKRAGMAGAALTIPLAPVIAESTSAPPASAPAAQAPASPSASPSVSREPFENLTASESDLLEVICSRLIPSDENGPGAREARAAHYIDRALGGALAASKPAYVAGFAALDRYARSSRGRPFLELPERDMDSVLIDVETGAATGFQGSPAAFFAMVRTHTLQGTFGDPYYGGNANFVGWDMLGYPGVRANVSADEQRLGAKLVPNHRSAYDTEMFTKAVASRGVTGPAKAGHHIDGGHHMDGPAEAGHYIQEAKRHGD